MNHLNKQIAILTGHREKFLRTRPIASIVKTLGKLSSHWLDSKYSFRKKAVRKLVEKSKFSKEMAEALLDALFQELTTPKLFQLLKFEIGDPKVLDDFKKNPLTGFQHRAQGPKLITHIFSGNMPNPSIVSFILGMLVKSVNVGKLSRLDEGFFKIYLESLKNFDKKLASTNFLIDSNDRKALSEAMKSSNLVVAYGSDKNLKDIQKLVPARTPFVAYGHRVSFGFYTKEVLTPGNLTRLARDTARDVWMADQRGCLSPLAIFTQMGGKISVLNFAEALSRELTKLSKNKSVAVDFDRLARSRDLQNRYRLKQVAGESVRFWESDPKGRWSVFYDEKIRELTLSEGGQVIYVKAFRNTREVFGAISPLQKYLQSVSLETTPKHREALAAQLATLGVNRITRAGQMQSPPVTWHHDAKPNLAHWLTWTDLE